MTTPGDGRNQVVDLSVIDTDWGNAVSDRTVQSYPDQTTRDAAWVNPRNGSVSYTADSDETWVRRAGKWSRIPDGYIGSKWGPPTDVLATSTLTTLIEFDWPVKINRNYLVTGFCYGAQVSAAGIRTGAGLNDDQGGGRWICVSNSIQNGVSLSGSTTMIYTPSSTKTAWVKLQAIADTGGFLVNQCQISVIDIGG